MIYRYDDNFEISYGDTDCNGLREIIAEINNYIP